MLTALCDVKARLNRIQQRGFPENTLQTLRDWAWGVPAKGDSTDTHPGFGIDLATAVQQELHHVRVAPFGGHVQRGDAVLQGESTEYVRRDRARGLWQNLVPTSTRQCPQCLRHQSSTDRKALARE